MSTTSSLRQARKDLAQFIRRSTGNHLSIRNKEVRVPLHIIQAVKICHCLLRERGLHIEAACGSEFSEPEWLAWGRLVNLANVALEVLEVVVGVIPMDRDEINGAIAAIGQELCQPRETTVADSGCAKLSFSRELLHVRPAGYGVGDGDRTAAVDGWLIGLVEAEEVFGAGVDGGLGGGGPAVDVVA